MKRIGVLFLLPLAAAAQDDVKFTTQALVMHGNRQDTITYDFTGDGKLDLLCTCIDLESDIPVRWAFLYPQKADGTFAAKPERCLQIPESACALVFGDYDGSEAVEIAFLAADGFYFFPTGADQPSKLLHTAVFFSAPSDFILPVWQYRQDLDGNKLDDLILPAEKGYKVYFQTEKGRFRRVQPLEPDDAGRRALRVTSRAVQDRYRATTLKFEKLVPRLDVVDINADGRKDLVSVSRDLLTIFFMNADGIYDALRQGRSGRRRSDRRSVRRPERRQVPRAGRHQN